MSIRTNAWLRDQNFVTSVVGFVSGFDAAALERTGNTELVKTLDTQLPVAAEAMRKVWQILRRLGQEDVSGCSICGATDRKAKGLCTVHYSSWWSYGQPRVDDWVHWAKMKEAGRADEKNPVPPPSSGHTARLGPYKIQKALPNNASK